MARLVQTYTPSELIPAFDPDDAPCLPVKLANGTYAAGTVLGRVTSSGSYAAYASGATNGSEVPRGLLKYGVVVAAGLVTNLDEFSAGFNGTVPMFVGGNFRTEDLTGLDAAAVTALGGHVAVGTLTAGIFHF